MRYPWQPHSLLPSMQRLIQNIKINLAGLRGGKFNRSLFVNVCSGTIARSYCSAAAPLAQYISITITASVSWSSHLRIWSITLQQSCSLLAIRSLSAAQTLTHSVILSGVVYKVSVAVSQPQEHRHKTRQSVFNYHFNKVFVLTD